MAISAESTVRAMRRTKRVDPAILKSFGEQLDKWVKAEHEDNQSSAGRALGLSQGHISAMIQGHRGPGLPTLIELARVSGRSIDWWLGLERERSREDAILERLQAIEAREARILAEYERMRLDSSSPPKLLPPKGKSDAPRPRRR